MNLYKTSETELHDIFDLYSQDERTITLSSLQKLSHNFQFAVSSSEIESFWLQNLYENENKNANDSPILINFIEFAQFVRHQESTLKQLFTFLNLKHSYSEIINISDILSDINEYVSNPRNQLKQHYYWTIDTDWVSTIFAINNQRRSLDDEHSITYLQFCQEALLGSTPSLHRYYRGSLALNAQDHNDAVDYDSDNDDNDRYLELYSMFDTLSLGRGFIDVRTLYHVVRRTCVPVSEHQLMSFFYSCDINEDGRIDFIEFCHFIKEEEDAIRELFDSLDLNSSGYLTLDEIRRSFHIKYIVDHKSTINSEFSNDINKIDEWINTVVSNIPNKSPNNSDKSDNSDNSGNDIRISYSDFRTYAILSGTRNLLSMTQLATPSSYHSDNFLFDFDPNLPSHIDESYDNFLIDIGDPYKHSKLNLITFISGTIAGITSRTCTAPIDRVKLFMQLKSHGSIGKHVNDIITEGIHNKYKLPILSFWRGNLTNCIKMAPETAIKFTVHSIILRYLPQSNSHLNYFIAGAGAGFISQTFIYPLEIAKTRLALSKYGQYNNAIDCISQIYKYEGYRALYNGWTASVTGIIPYCAIEMGVFYTLKQKWKLRYMREPDIATLFSIGGISSISGTIISYPFQLVRTKLQTQGMPGSYTKNIIYNGLGDCFKKTYQKYGIFGLYSGLIPNCAKGIPASCIAYVVVEKSRQFLKKIANID